MRVALNFPAIGSRRGGAETYVGVLARALDQAGHEVHVLATRVDPGELPPSITVHLIPIRAWRGFGWLRSYQFAAASARELSRHSFDLVIGFGQVWQQDVCIAIGGSRPALLECSAQRFRSLAARACWMLGKRLNPNQWACRWIEHQQFARGRAPLVIAPSHRVADDFRRWHDVPESHLAVAHLGVELKASRDASRDSVRQDIRTQWGLKSDDVAILFSARNYSLKGMAALLESFVAVARDSPDAQLLICGTDRDRSWQRRVGRLGLSGRVRFLGFVSDTRACFAGADVFVLPTFYDACSLVVLEALAAGLPVVTTRANGAAELVTEGRDGFVIDSPWAIDQLSERLLRLSADGVLRRRMSQQARSGARRLSIENSVQAMLAALHRRTRLHEPHAPSTWSRAA